MASACYTAVAQDTAGPDCGVSCTGLYADVAFTEDTFIKEKDIPFLANDMYGRKVIIKHVEADQDKARQKLIQLLKIYTAYKKSFVKQIRLNPDLSNLSKF